VPGPISPLAPPTFPALPVIEGARFSATQAGVRYADRTDVMLAALAPGTRLAGVFTRSTTRAAPVLDCEAKIGRDAPGAGAAIVVNSGNANAFTGGAGLTAVREVAAAAARCLGVPAMRVLTASTGVIGERLRQDRIVAVMERLADGLSETAMGAAAGAIMTTDTFRKGAAAELTLGGGSVRIAGIAKGSGMIAPDMATMLAFLFTDADVPRAALQQALSQGCWTTFNAITVDGETSTSDTVLAAATGRSGVAVETDEDRAAFATALHGVMRDLAHQIVRDGEGATKFIEVRVTGATTDSDARRVAASIANSPLVKTAAAGEDPNWGRIVMAVGKSGAAADRDRLAIRLGDILVAERGWVAEGYREADGAAYMQRPELVFAVDLGLGRGTATMWTCDLTRRYVEINADYRS
jgi:glutamate N-acetyltransferase/amino-acid N-acetyltransferase